MSESDLNTYKLQIQQVVAALTADPENQELLTLKADLEQVIELTQDLLKAQAEATPSASSSTSTSSAPKYRDDAMIKKKPTINKDVMPVKHWQVGEQCQAPLSGDGNYQEATIEDISTDGVVSLKFNGGQTGMTSLGSLKISNLGLTGTAGRINKKEMLAKQKEYLKKKKARKLEKRQEMEKVKEEEKTKWKSFSNKAFGKKGFVKKSIFKTPENANGRVGIGTCGHSGNNMTTYSSAHKHRKGT